MIKRVAMVGAAAWTAPLVIESLTSPAGALTPGPCTKYAVKLDGDSTTCAPYCFENGSGYTFPANDAYWGGSCPRPTGCGSNTTMTGGSGPKMPTSNTPQSFFNSTLGANVAYQKILLPAGCYFSSTTGWQIGGRYGPGDPGNIWLQAPVSATCASGPVGGTSIGCYTEGGNTAWILKYQDGRTTTSPTRLITYVYLKYCCGS